MQVTVDAWMVTRRFNVLPTRISAHSLHSFPFWPGGAGKHTTSGPERAGPNVSIGKSQLFRRSRMPNRPGNDDRTAGGVGDRGAQRD
ncbi:MAG TPA: hypothetical protein VKP00_11875, partial [Gemmatimonadaceae bacterium]|nr:hypothetical protein [Gemmatimonadaceae bacterium]